MKRLLAIALMVVGLIFNTLSVKAADMSAQAVPVAPAGMTDVTVCWDFRVRWFYRW